MRKNGMAGCLISNHLNNQLKLNSQDTETKGNEYKLHTNVKGTYAIIRITRSRGLDQIFSGNKFHSRWDRSPSWLRLSRRLDGRGLTNHTSFELGHFGRQRLVRLVGWIGGEMKQHIIRHCVNGNAASNLWLKPVYSKPFKKTSNHVCSLFDSIWIWGKPYWNAGFHSVQKQSVCTI